MPIDYEAEYNNRARVPEHVDILPRWAREAAAYRDEMRGRGEAELGIAFGPTPRQTIDLFGPADKGRPLALFIHGGYWRALEPASFSHVARGLVGHGATVAVAGYDLCPQVTIADIVGQMRSAALHLWRRFGRRVLVYGHSAGGHLAATLLATEWDGLDASAPADLVPAAYSISGLFDLAPLVRVAMNQDLCLDEAQARAASPLFWPAPKGLTLDAVVGGDESSEFLRQSRIIVDGWGKAGVTTRYEAIAGANHFTVIEPLADPHSAMVQRLAAMAKSVA